MATTSLDFKGAGLTEFPREEVFAHAETLEFLDLSGNRIELLPDGVSQLRRLRVLFASGNPIRHLPASLGACSKLRTLGLRGCGLESVAPGAIPESLEALILTDNRLTELPPGIGRCRNLRKLMLTGNLLTGLPEFLRDCAELELLRVAVNQMEALPAWLLQMPKLAWVALGGNPLSRAGAERADTMESISWSELRLLETLGQGASGVIHKAFWQRAPAEAGREVAVKIFKGDLTSDGLPGSEMSASLAAGRHANLVPILGRCSDHPQGAEALVMELIDPVFVNLAGPPSLDTCTRDIYPEARRFRCTSVWRTALGVAEAGAHLHERGILHGDLYAHNLLWQAEAHRVLLGDFGAASRHEPGEERAIALQRLEVRAFGVLLNELMERCDDSSGDAESETLEALRTSCLRAEAAARPLFSGIVRQLRRD